MQLFDATVTSSVRHWDSTVALNPGPVNSERLEVTPNTNYVLFYFYMIVNLFVLWAKGL